MKAIIRFTTLLLLLLNSSLVIAETQLTLSPSFLHFDYTEFSTTDQVLDREKGWLPGLNADLRYRITPEWQIGVHTAYYQGTVDYDGQTQSGVPQSTDTKTKLFRLGARVARSLIENMHLFVGVQSHQWQRNIQDNNNVSGLDETYQWLEYSIGLNSDFPVTVIDTINLEAGFLLIRNADIEVDLSKVNLGTATLDIGDGTGGRLNATWTHQHVNNTRYGFSVFFEAWQFGRSNTKQTQGGSSIVFVTEPRSETRNIGLKLNIEYSF